MRTFDDSPHQRPYSDGGENSAQYIKPGLFAGTGLGHRYKHGKNSDESQRHINPEDRLP